MATERLYTREELATNLGVSAQTIARWERIGIAPLKPRKTVRQRLVRYTNEDLRLYREWMKDDPLDTRPNQRPSVRNEDVTQDPISADPMAMHAQVVQHANAVVQARVDGKLKGDSPWGRYPAPPSKTAQIAPPRSAYVAPSTKQTSVPQGTPTDPAGYPDGCVSDEDKALFDECINECVGEGMFLVDALPEATRRYDERLEQMFGGPHDGVDTVTGSE